MSLASLIKISPLIIGTSSRLDVYASSMDDASVCGLNGVLWEPAMVAAPTLTMTLWDGDFTSAVEAGSASFSLKMNVLKNTYAADNCMWVGAPVEIYAEAPGTAWPWTLRFKGKVSSFTRRDQTLSVTAEVDNEPFAANVLTATYAGTGGAEGSSNLKDRVKPLVIGYASNVEPVMIDETNSVYQFSGYGAIEGVPTLYERGSDFGASVGDYASYTALVAASIPAGRWGTCLAAGMVRLGAPAAGVITGDVRGHRVGGTTPRLTGAVISALATIAGISGSLINSASLTSLNAAVPFNINLVLTDQVSFVDIATELARCCNWQAGVSLTGTYFVSRIDFTGSEVLTLNARGESSPLVLRSDELDTSIPYYRTVMGAARSWRVHTGDEIAYYNTIEEKGLYSASTTYKAGQIVSLADQSRWIYKNATPASGNAPPTWPTTSNAWWDNLSGPVVATAITYADGSTIESLKPAQVGADKTSTNTAAGISGQGPLATSALTAGEVTNAYVSDANICPNGGLQVSALGWTLGSGATATKGSAANEPDYYVRNTTDLAESISPQVSSTERSFKSRPGEKLYLQFMVRTQVIGSATCRGRVRFVWYDAANNSITGDELFAAPTAANTWQSFVGVTTVPANAVKGQIRFRPNTGAGWVDVGPIFVGRAESGADITANNIAASIAGQGALATKNAVNLSTADVSVLGSIPLSVPDGGFTYTSTVSSVTISWSAFTVYRADMSTIAVSSGSQAITGLSASTTYRVYPYIVDSGGGSATVAFVTGAASGSPSITFPSAGSALAAATMNQRGNIPLGRFNVVTPGSGSGGGSGGGFNCLHPMMEVDGILARDLSIGDYVATPKGPAPIMMMARRPCSEWFVLLSGRHEVARVTREHLFYRAQGGPVKACDLKVGDLLAASGDHVEITGIMLDRTPALLVGLGIPDPYLHYGGPMNLLMHNGTDKP